MPTISPRMTALKDAASPRHNVPVLIRKRVKLKKKDTVSQTSTSTNLQPMSVQPRLEKPSPGVISTIPIAAHLISSPRTAPPAPPASPFPASSPVQSPCHSRRTSNEATASTKSIAWGTDRVSHLKPEASVSESVSASIPNLPRSESVRSILKNSTDAFVPNPNPHLPSSDLPFPGLYDEQNVIPEYAGMSDLDTPSLISREPTPRVVKMNSEDSLLTYTTVSTATTDVSHATTDTPSHTEEGRSSLTFTSQTRVIAQLPKETKPSNMTKRPNSAKADKSGWTRVRRNNVRLHRARMQRWRGATVRSKTLTPNSRRKKHRSENAIQQHIHRMSGKYGSLPL